MTFSWFECYRSGKGRVSLVKYFPSPKTVPSGLLLLVRCRYLNHSCSFELNNEGSHSWDIECFLDRSESRIENRFKDEHPKNECRSKNTKQPSKAKFERIPFLSKTHFPFEDIRRTIY